VDDNLTDQQRAEQIRIWLGENGWYLLAGLALGLAGLFGWRQWNSYSSTHAEQASALYEEMLTAIRVGRGTRADEIAARLAQDFASTPYLDQARLAMAKMKLDESRPEDATKYLQQVVEHSDTPEVVNIARMRLARVLAQEEKYEDALKVLSDPGDSAFGPRFHEVRGDIYYAMGRPDEARAEYEAALRGDPTAVGDPAFLQAKLAELAGSAAPAAAAAPAGEVPSAEAPASN
jgi:predicted negative regulator of RcsB-dependent stress response